MVELATKGREQALQILPWPQDESRSAPQDANLMRFASCAGADDVSLELRRELARHLVSVYARDRLVDALHQVAMDGLHPAFRCVATTADQVWLRVALADPLREAARTALEALIDGLAAVLPEAPNGLCARLEQAPRWRDPGY